MAYARNSRYKERIAADLDRRLAGLSDSEAIALLDREIALLFDPRERMPKDAGPLRKQTRDMENYRAWCDRNREKLREYKRRYLERKKAG